MSGEQFVENGNWTIVMANVMKELLANSKGLTYAENGGKLLSALNEANMAQMETRQGN